MALDDSEILKNAFQDAPEPAAPKDPNSSEAQQNRLANFGQTKDDYFVGQSVERADLADLNAHKDIKPGNDGECGNVSVVAVGSYKEGQG